MNVLVTAGNTQTPIDRVRCITNIFTGRTGAMVALEAWRRGHHVRLLTSHPEVVIDLARGLPGFPDGRWQVLPYRTFDDLHDLLESHITSGRLDAIFHAAAVSDYHSAGIFAPGDGTHFDPEKAAWIATSGKPTLVDRFAGKVKSDEPELWLRLVRAPKLVDRIRDPWGFDGLLVKFKLEVGVTDAELEARGERSRVISRADYMVANTLEGAADWAILGPVEGKYQRVTRQELPVRLLALAEAWRG